MIRALGLLACLAAGGCACHKANQYTYAPPLAPPVYPQPQTAAQPVAYPAAPPAAGAPVMPAPAYPPAAAMGGGAVTMVAGEVPALPDGSCPPCAGGVVPAVHDGAVQAVPCP